MERELTQFENYVLDFIKAYPNRTPEDIDKEIGGDAFNAVYHLVGAGFADMDRVTYAVTAREA